MKNTLIDYTLFGQPVVISQSPSFTTRERQQQQTVAPCRSVSSGKCIECKGSGSLSGYISGIFGAYLSHHRYTVTCQQCNGTGKVERKEVAR